jgi:hypothetical protein
VDPYVEVAGIQMARCTIKRHSYMHICNLSFPLPVTDCQSQIKSGAESALQISSCENTPNMDLVTETLV